MTRSVRVCRAAALALLVGLPALAIDAPGRATDVGRSYRVPYRLTDTNHFLVRVRIDGKGPFNFLVDTGAPALFVGAEAAKKVGIKPNPDDFFTPIGRLDFEGGASLTGMNARVEDPFQMVGMNALGLPGGVDRRHPRLHGAGPVQDRDRPDPRPDDLDPARLRSQGPVRPPGCAPGKGPPPRCRR